MPLAHSARTLPSVSLPSSVVRSIIRIARSSAQSFDSRLIERFLRLLDTLLDAHLVDAADTLDHRLDAVGATNPGAHQRAGLAFG